MIKPPKLLFDEEMKLIEEYFSLFPEDRVKIYSVDEQRLENPRMFQWLYDNASAELKLYWDYRNYLGDECQLCDGKGIPLKLSSDNGAAWIQEWDVDKDGHCLYKNTNELIRNTDGTPIKTPKLDERVIELYQKERNK